MNPQGTYTMDESNTDASMVLEYIRVVSREGSLVFTFLLLEDKNRFVKLVKKLDNSYTQGQYRCPKNMAEAYKILKNWKQGPSNMVQMVRPTTNSTMAEVAFVNADGYKADLEVTAMVLVAGKYVR